MKMDLSIITYNLTSAQMMQLSTFDELSKVNKNSKKLWINISGLKDVDSIKKLCESYNIHPLTIEDVFHTEQQPKIEVFDKYWFLSMKTIQRDKKFQHNKEKKKKKFLFFKKKKQQTTEPEEFIFDQVSMIIMKDVVITFQEIDSESFNVVRKKLLNGKGSIRKMGMFYLAYAIIDAIVDEYTITLNHLEDDIENFESRATKTSDDMFIEEIQNSKKYLSQIRRAILPLKDNISIITKQERFFQTAEIKPFLRDLSDNLNNAIIAVDNYRELLSSIMNVNLSVLSHQLNKVMKVLATISTIFIPLTFIAGVYGMNFDFMPELRYKIAYPIVLICMALIAGIMIIIFKIRRWF